MQKIAETLRIQQIRTTDDIQLATVVIEPHKQSKNLTVAIICDAVKKELTTAKLAEKLVEDTQQELIELKQLIEQSQTFFVPEVLNFPNIQLLEPKSKKKINIEKNISKYNSNRYKQTHKQIFFNRTRCK